MKQDLYSHELINQSSWLESIYSKGHTSGKTNNFLLAEFINRIRKHLEIIHEGNAQVTLWFDSLALATGVLIHCSEKPKVEKG